MLKHGCIEAIVTMGPQNGDDPINYYDVDDTRIVRALERTGLKVYHPICPNGSFVIEIPSDFLNKHPLK